MDFKTIKSRAFVLLAALTILTLTATFATAKIALNDGVKVSLSDSSMDTGDSFDVEITLQDPDDTDNDVDVYVEIRAGGVLVHEKNYPTDIVEGNDSEITINSDNFETDDGKIWKENLMNYECNDNLKIEVTVSDGVDEESDYDELDLSPAKSAYELNAEMDPLTPTLTEKFTVTVTDEDEDELKDAYVKFTWIDDEDGNDDDAWDVEDESFSGKTDSDGEVEFNTFAREVANDAFGKYQMDVYKAGYCKITKTITIANTLNISNPVPENPQAGEPFKVRVLKPGGTPATGLFVYLSPGGLRSSVTSDGYASFTIPSDGTYTLSAGGTGTAFDETYKTVKVERKMTLSITASPNPANTNEQVRITVKSGADEISGVSVYVKKDAGTEEKLSGMTDSDGIIPYTPSEAGEYSIRAEKTGYGPGASSFSVKNTFKVTLPDLSNLQGGEPIIVTVTDMAGNPVPSATVSVELTSISGLTDASGRFSFVLDKPGTYSLVVRKTNYADLRRTLTNTGKLYVKLSEGQINMGDEIKITVTNRDGAITIATIKITGPDGVKTETGSEYSYKPTKAGSYSVSAEAPNYNPGVNNFTVAPKPLSFTYAFKDGKLAVNVTSNGKPVKDLLLDVDASGDKKSVTTGADGMAYIDGAKAGINYTISVTHPDYVKKEVSATMNAGLLDSGMFLPLLIVLFAIVLVMIFIVVLIFLIQKKKGGSSGKIFQKGSGSRLSP